MDKNVGSVDIEELKRTREELNEERGIENDPNMYSSYNLDANRDYLSESENRDLPNDSENENLTESVDSETQLQKDIDESFEDKESEDSQQNDASEENVSGDDLIDMISSAMANDNENQNNDTPEVQETKQTTNQSFESNNGLSTESQKDFDVYDKFSAFEVTPRQTEETEATSPQSNSDSNVETNVDSSDEPNISLEESDENQGEEISLFDDNDSKTTDIEDTKSASQSDLQSTETNETSDNLLSSIGTIDFDSMKNTETAQDTEVEDVQNAKQEQNIETEAEQNTETEAVQTIENSTVEPEINSQDNAEILLEKEEPNEDSLENGNESLTMENQESQNASENTNEPSQDYNTEVIDDYKKLENLDKLISEEDKSIPEIDIQKPKIDYADIEPFEFVDLISTDEFKNSDKISYILGKDESGKVCYGNLRDLYNIAIFGKENNSVVSLVHSIIISLILKNNVSDINFVICDSKADSKFEVYDKSTYMYFNRIAKTNKEILDSLIELTKELEERYKILATTGVKSIEQYNIIAKNDNLKPLPYLLLVFNNYSKSSQLTEADKINTCLYQLLKLGRCVGMYEIIIANTSIKSDEINYNLPTRIAFLSDDEDDSLATFGEVGAEQLPTSSDFLLSSIEKSKVMHLRVPNITKSEIEVLIESINE